MKQSETIVQIEQLTKTYKETNVLENITLNLSKGKIYGLIGMNGAGKTTLMKCLLNMSTPSDGTITLFNGQDALKRIGMMIEAPAFFEQMSAKQNLEYYRKLKGIPNKSRIDEVLKLVGLENVDKKKTKDFSLGMKQRLGIAIALLSKPELLVLDEPINGLDPKGVVSIRNLFKSLVEEHDMTILLSSHNLPELYQTASDYIFIHKGKLVEQLTLSELEDACRHYVAIECEDPATAVTILEQQFQFTNYKLMPNGQIRLFDGVDQLADISTMLVQQGLRLTRFSLEGETLENYFLTLVGGEQHD
ncbi:ABC transporter ATP-binding protein [Solibacillus sp.]|uniref:ABC transporter ATP-binding protein n=1 Tax=Solibacillus sp. TaxID=1909654 RepID=UPI0033159290